MATENILQLVSRQAGSNITNKRAVLEVAGGIVNRVAVQGVQIHGVIAMRSYGVTGSTITAGDEAPVAKKGTVICEAGAAVADGAEVMSNNVGQMITFAAAANTYAVGKVVNGSSATAAGQDISVELYELGMHL